MLVRPSTASKELFKWSKNTLMTPEENQIMMKTLRTTLKSDIAKLPIERSRRASLRKASH